MKPPRIPSELSSDLLMELQGLEELQSRRAPTSWGAPISSRSSNLPSPHPDQELAPLKGPEIPESSSTTPPLGLNPMDVAQQGKGAGMNPPREPWNARKSPTAWFSRQECSAAPGMEAWAGPSLPSHLSGSPTSAPGAGMPSGKQAGAAEPIPTPSQAWSPSQPHPNPAPRLIRNQLRQQRATGAPPANQLGEAFPCTAGPGSGTNTWGRGGNSMWLAREQRE